MNRKTIGVIVAASLLGVGLLPSKPKDSTPDEHIIQGTQAKVTGLLVGSGQKGGHPPVKNPTSPKAPVSVPLEKPTAESIITQIFMEIGDPKISKITQEMLWFQEAKNKLEEILKDSSLTEAQREVSIQVIIKYITGNMGVLQQMDRLSNSFPTLIGELKKDPSTWNKFVAGHIEPTEFYYTVVLDISIMLVYKLNQSEIYQFVSGTVPGWESLDAGSQRKIIDQADDIATSRNSNEELLTAMNVLRLSRMELYNTNLGSPVEKLEAIIRITQSLQGGFSKDMIMEIFAASVDPKEIINQIYSTILEQREIHGQ